MYDEAYARPRIPRPHYAELLGEPRPTDVVELREQVEDWVAVHGVTFADEPFVVDPVPRVLTAAEWSELEAGLAEHGANPIATAGVDVVRDDRAASSCSRTTSARRRAWPTRSPRCKPATCCCPTIRRCAASSAGSTCSAPRWAAA
jgi:hypothetical protein